MKDTDTDTDPKKAELENILLETLTAMGGTDPTYTELLAFFLKHKMLSKPKRLMIGQLLFFKYLPTNKRFIESNRYYDIYPLIFVTDSYRGGFRGINLHYLDPETRNLLFENMMKQFTTTKGRDHRTNRILLNYSALSSRRTLRAFEPCFKQYRWNGIQKQPMLIPFDFWQTLINQDLGFFRKKKKPNIYLESWRIIRKQPSSKRK